jgi:hypothetical protein
VEENMKALLLAVTIAMLSCGASFAGEPSDDNPAPTDESAKMGKDEGTHTGEHGAKPENDTKKVEQPDRKNVPSNPQ